MNFSVKVEGLDKLQDQLEEVLGAELAVKALGRAARKAFAPVLETAKALVQVSQGELRDAIKITVKKPSRGEAVVVVGLRISKGLGGEVPASRRWHFIEFGTAHMSANPFLRPALDRNASQVVDLLKAELATMLERAQRKARK